MKMLMIFLAQDNLLKRRFAKEIKEKEDDNL